MRFQEMSHQFRYSEGRATRRKSVDVDAIRSAQVKRILVEANLYGAFPGVKPFSEEQAFAHFMKSTHPRKVVFVMDNIVALGPHMHLFVTGIGEDVPDLIAFTVQFVSHPAFKSSTMAQLPDATRALHGHVLCQIIRLFLATIPDCIASKAKWGTARCSHPLLKKGHIFGILKVIEHAKDNLPDATELTELGGRLESWSQQI